MFFESSRGLTATEFANTRVHAFRDIENRSPPFSLAHPRREPILLGSSLSARTFAMRRLFLHELPANDDDGTDD